MGGRNGVKGAVFRRSSRPLTPFRPPHQNRVGNKAQMFFLSFVPCQALFCETTQARFLHLNHFSMATLGSINHVFGLIQRHDY